jgi:hypothetical protein
VVKDLLEPELPCLVFLGLFESAATVAHILQAICQFYCRVTVPDDLIPFPMVAVHLNDITQDDDLALSVVLHFKTFDGLAILFERVLVISLSAVNLGQPDERTTFPFLIDTFSLLQGLFCAVLSLQIFMMLQMIIGRDEQTVNRVAWIEGKGTRGNVNDFSWGVE